MKIPKNSRHSLRIISGKWRGRKLSFPVLPGLRPTPDRIRETLFNWLAPHIHGARCLDLFAGSGALGLEALSRGASHVDFYDSAYPVIGHIKDCLTRFDTHAAKVYLAEIPEQLPQTSTQAFNIIFLDPPFHQGLLEPCCHWLENHGWVAAKAMIYLECEATLPLLNLPEQWQVHHSKKAGQVSYHLAQKI
jgi:16S rRNA (guanine966-N2)-methyltransferase